jgi:hypothetical protein
VSQIDFGFDDARVWVVNMTTTPVPCRPVEKARPGDVIYVGRGTRYGNPFGWGGTGSYEIGVENREQALAGYLAWLDGRITVPGRVPPNRAEIQAELRGRMLGCWCKPRQCHADILARIANEEP